MCSVFSIEVYAYREETHQALSEEALKKSDIALSPFLVTDFGFGAYTEVRLPSPENTNERNTIVGLIRDGAKFEDNSTRPINHFYNPVTNQGLPVGNASPDWTLEDVNDIPEQAYSYNDAMRFLYLALTSQTEEERELNWAKTFQTLGQVIHHVQDMAQPAHTRNDLHCDALPCLITLALYDPSWYEQYTNDHKADAYFKSLMTVNGYPIPRFDTAREFWTTRAGDTSIMDRRGMADYTNRNFVSKDTIFQLHGGAIVPHGEYPYPEPDVTPVTVNIADPGIKGAQGQAVCDSIRARSIIPFPDSACYMDFVSTPVNDAFTGSSSTNDRAATYSIFDKKLLDHNIDATYIREDGSIDTVDRSFTLNEFNFKAAHNYLIPRAVAYSAGLINHFFRSKIDMIPNPDGEGWLIKNLSNEDMQGTFTLFYNHVNPVDNQEKRDPVPGASWALTIAANSELVVGPYTVPEGLIYKTLVFNGRLGEEDNVVAGKISGAWSAPLAIGENIDFIPDVAMDSSGNVILIYGTYDQSADTVNVWSRRYTPSDGWGDAILIDNNNGIYRDYNALSMDIDGNALLVYSNFDSDNHIYSPRSQVYTPSTGWSGATAIASDTYRQYHYALSMDGSGNAIVVYRTYDFINGTYIHSLWSRHYTPATGWGNAMLIENLNNSHADHALSMDANGSALLVYCNYDSDTQADSLWSRHYTPAGGWSDPTLIDNRRSISLYHDALALNADGNAMLAYFMSDAGESSKAWIRRYTPSDGWDNGELLDSATPLIDVDSRGNVIALFKGADKTATVKHYTPSMGWGNVIRLSEFNQVPVLGYVEAIDVEFNGKAVVVWKDTDGILWSNFYTP